MAFTSRRLSAVLIAGWNVVSLCFELRLYTMVYRLAENILAYKMPVNKADESIFGDNYRRDQVILYFFSFRRI